MSLARSYDMTASSPQSPKWYLLEGVDVRMKWLVIITFLVSLGMLIAGSVMLGIGLSQNCPAPHVPCPVTTTSTGYTAILRVHSTKVSYDSVVSDYSGSVKSLTTQLQQALNIQSPSFANLDATSNVPITILGITNTTGTADVMYALSYTDSNEPSIASLKQKIDASPNFDYLSASDKTPASLSSMECAAVSVVAPTTGSTTISTTRRTTSLSTVPTFSTSSSSVASSKPTVTVPIETTTQNILTTVPVPIVPSAFVQDITILLDDSSSYGSAKNFNSIKKWINERLIARWKVDPAYVQVAFATFSSGDFNLAVFFDENTSDDVTYVIAAQQYMNQYTPSITNGLRSASQLPVNRAVNKTTILISASENLTDIEQAASYSGLFSNGQKQLITVTLNSKTAGKQLGLLSTLQNEFFGVSDFALTDDIAQKITAKMFGIPAPTTGPITPSIPDNTCNSDITLIIDWSNDISSVEEYNKEIDFIRSLVKTWHISPKAVETEAVFYSSVEGGVIVENAFNYQSASAFANELLDYKNSYFDGSAPSISGSLRYLTQNLDNRRAGRQQTIILFTYSSDAADVRNAYQYVDHLGGNLIIVAINSADVTTLNQLTGNVIFSSTLSSDLINKINDVICMPTTRASLQTTAAPKLTTAVKTTRTIPTTVMSTQPPTTPFVDTCPDCVPKTSNILLLLETFGSTLDSQKNLTSGSLATSWNHFDRVSLVGYSTKTKYQDLTNFGDLNDLDEFQSIVGGLVAMPDKPLISGAFYLANTLETPLPNYGRISSVIFTTGATSDDITAALSNSKILRSKGKVIIVAINVDDTTSLSVLADQVLTWNKDLTNYKNISDQINTALNN